MKEIAANFLLHLPPFVPLSAPVPYLALRLTGFCRQAVIHSLSGIPPTDFCQLNSPFDEPQKMSSNLTPLQSAGTFLKSWSIMKKTNPHLRSIPLHL